MRSVLRPLVRLLTWVGILFLLLAALGGGALWLTLPRSDQAAQIAGLSAPVEIGFDQDGIPRIHAANALDAAAALGFVHARDRMFQMELMRRAASGRLSEIAGPATLPLDRMMRTLGLRRRAEADLATLPPETRALLEAYARGVNAWIAARGRFAAPEFLVLGAPEPWTAVDSLLWGKTMGVWLSANWRTELARLALHGHLSPRMIEALWPAGRADATAGGRGADGAGSVCPGGAAPRRGAAGVPRAVHPARTASQRMGGGRARTPRPARRCWPAIRIWRSAFPASGTWRASTRRTACWPARPRPACRSW